MIKQIIKVLSTFTEISDWRIKSVDNVCEQAFFVLGKLETNRLVETKKYHVTVYTKTSEKTIGQSSFIVSHKISTSELKKLVETAISSSKFIFNPTYELVEGTTKKNFKAKGFDVSSDEMFSKIINVYNGISTPNIKFNAVEVFIKTTITNLVTSKGVDYTKKTKSIGIEAIPSYDGEQKVELYKYHTYDDFNIEKIENDAKVALADVTARYNAVKLASVDKIDVILRSEDIKGFMWEIISNYNYQAVYTHSSPHNLGEYIEDEKAKDLLTIKLDKLSKYDAFDDDGVLLNEVTVVDKGIIVNNFGNNQFASYLGVKPTGSLPLLKLNNGKKTYESLTKEPYLEIVALSGLQVESLDHYIGGEVRLALYFDGTNLTPVSGFSFSGNIDQALKDMELSKEKEEIEGYNGPKYLKIKDMQIVA